MQCQIDNLKVEYNDPHKHASKLHGFPFTRSAILLSQTFKTSFDHMHLITNGFKRFSKTNSSDPRQRVPLTTLHNVCARCDLFIIVTSLY